jgi:uncharacterized membrane protein YesL
VASRADIRPEAAPAAGAPAAASPAAGSPAAAGPTLGGAIRRALTDAYYHSWRLVPANLVWAFVAVVLATSAAFVPATVVLLPVLALPTAGLFRVATRIVRGEAVSFWDALDAWRTDVVPVLGLGAVGVLAVVVLGANTVVGLGSGSPLGWALATMAAWGLIVLWLLAWTVWPILLDPSRAATPVRDRLRLAALLVLAHPIRIGALATLLTVFLVLSAIAIVALVSVSMALAALVASRFVLPAADRLEVALASRAA